jgi:ornithine cyclodeaminase
MFDRGQVEAKLSLSACIDVMDATMQALAKGEAILPLRTHLGLPSGDGLLLMPSALPHANAVGVKLLSLFMGNPARGLPAIQGVVVLFDAQTGQLQAVADAVSITAIRTAAVSGAATRLLANPDADDLALLGSGTQASSHLSAMLAVRPIRRVRVWSRNFDNACAFAERESDKHDIAIHVCQEAEAAVVDASIICTCTSATEPVLRGHWVGAGAHINAVGAYTPYMRECDSDLVARARLFVDTRESALAEAGDLLIPLGEGRIGASAFESELGAALLGRVAGRQSSDEITLFKSCGLAVQDLAALGYLVQASSSQ